MKGARRGIISPPSFIFGGKSAIADVIWRALGDPLNYVEPFCGSAAVLFLRPNVGRIETINDADGFISNVWRALKMNPDAVAEHADYMVDESSLHARHLWLIGQRDSLTNRLCADPDFFDPKVAGYWLYGINCWIGSGWCSGNGPWVVENGEMVLGDAGKGVNRQLPHLRNAGQGVNRKLPHLGDAGKGEELPGLGECERRREWLKSYLGWFADRLRNVRVCCGDWSRVCGPSVTFRHGLTGIFIDSPYADTAGRTSDLYAVDCLQVAHKAREWAIEQGQNPLMRIVFAGYEGAHEFPEDWKVHEWEGAGGYGNSLGRLNRKRERLWMSKYCLDWKEKTFFDILEKKNEF